MHSPFGQVLKAIRENEPRAISLGYRVDRYKLLAFVLSAGFAGLGRCAEGAGARLRDAVGRAARRTSGEVILMTLLGGTGTFFGPVVGAGVVVTLQEYLSDLWAAGSRDHRRDLRRLRLVFRRGFVGEIERRFGQRTAPSDKAGSAALARAWSPVPRSLWRRGPPAPRSQAGGRWHW